MMLISVGNIGVVGAAARRRGGGIPIAVYPVVTGDVVEGQTLTVSDATWTTPPDSTSKQWWRADILVGGDVPIIYEGEVVYVGDREDIEGATSATYDIGLLDAGYDGKDYVIGCDETAIIGEKSYTVSSAATGPVVPLYHQKAGEFFLRLDVLDELPDPTRRTLISDTFEGLDAAGWLSRVSALHVMAAHSQVAALQNWMSDTIHAAIDGSVTFTTDRGFTGPGSGGRLTLGVAPTSIPGFTQNDCHIGAWALTAGTAGRSLIGTAASTTFRVRNNEGASERLLRLNTGTSLTTNDDVQTGHVVGARSASGQQRSYRNGGGEAIGSATSSAPPADAVLYLSSFGVDSDAQIAVGHLGASLTAQEVSDGYDVLLAFLQALGAVA